MRKKQKWKHTKKTAATKKKKKKKEREYFGNIRQVPSIVLFLRPFIRIDLLSVIQYTLRFRISCSLGHINKGIIVLVSASLIFFNSPYIIQLQCIYITIEICILCSSQNARQIGYRVMLYSSSGSRTLMFPSKFTGERRQRNTFTKCCLRYYDV